jgi:hypothetical protein
MCDEENDEEPNMLERDEEKRKAVLQMGTE